MVCACWLNSIVFYLPKTATIALYCYCVIDVLSLLLSGMNIVRQLRCNVHGFDLAFVEIKHWCTRYIIQSAATRAEELRG